MAEPPRLPRNMQDLLRLAIETQEGASSSSGATPPAPQPMDQNRQEWLTGAMSQLADPVAEMKKGIEIIGRAIADSNSSGMTDEVETGLASTLDVLIDYVGSIDYANDFNKLGGLSLFVPLLDMNITEIKIKACELFAEIVQNNPKAQSNAIEAGLMPVFTHLLDADSDNNVRVKALYALSCLVRDNPEAQHRFDSELDGLSVLLRAVQTETPDHKLRIKASFLLTSLTSSRPAFKDTLFRMGFVEQLVALLQTEHNSSHEYLLSALNALVSEHEAALKETHRPELRLAELLREKLNVLKDLPEFSEERYFASNLLQLCFPSQDSPEEER